MRHDPEIGSRVANNLGRIPAELPMLLDAPEDFPMQDLVVNIGLILREA